MEDFKETQRFNQWWIWVPYSIIFILVLILPLTKSNTLTSFEIEVFFGPVVMLLVAVLLYVSKLQTIVNGEGVKVRFFPFFAKWKVFKWDEITTTEVRKYKPIMEYGGWGLRGMFNNRAYTISGNMGLQLNFENRKVLIGSTQVEKLNQYLKYVKEKYQIKSIVVK